MDVQAWVTAEMEAGVGRLDGQVLGCIPPERRLERPGGGSSTTWVLWHLARHADLALTGVVQGSESVLTSFAGAGAGVPDVPPWLGLGEAEDRAVEAADPLAVEGYLRAVLSEAQRWWESGEVDLRAVPDASSALRAAGVPEDAYGWLHATWAGQPVAFFVRWELLGHVSNHVGELVATRNRMGLSPF